MKRFFFDRLLILAVVSFLPWVAYAQDDTMSFSEDEVDDDAAESDGEMSFDVEDTEQESEDIGQADILSVLEEEEEADQEVTAQSDASAEKT